MNSIKHQFTNMLCALVTVGAISAANPVLTPGVWKNITPQSLDMTGTYGLGKFAIAPSDPSIIYLCADDRGMWKTTDAGSTWKLLGVKPASAPWDDLHKDTCSYLDSPIHVAIDPTNPDRLYCVQGVRGYALGFWVSYNGGLGWKRSPTSEEDLTGLSVDPSDFNHVLTTTHAQTNPGVYETKDGGKTMILHPNDGKWGGGSQLIEFLHDPASGTGNSNTWLLGSSHFWRTEDGGTTWTKVIEKGTNHGGGFTCYTKSGVIYMAGTDVPMRSSDNGITWENVGAGLGGGSYYDIRTDGSKLYTSLSFGWNSYPIYIMTLPEGASAATSWIRYNPTGTLQAFTDGPLCMRFDSINRIMYAANWAAGFWALKVDIGSSTKSKGISSIPLVSKTVTANRIAIAKNGAIYMKRISSSSAISTYDIQGRMMKQPAVYPAMSRQAR